MTARGGCSDPDCDDCRAEWGSKYVSKSGGAMDVNINRRHRVALAAVVVLALLAVVLMLTGSARAQAAPVSKVVQRSVAHTALAPCNDPTSRIADKQVHTSDDGGDDDWTFIVKMWFQRCATRTDIRSVTYRYQVDSRGAGSPCSNWFGVDEIRMNTGLIGGWNPPAVAFKCQNNDPADARNIDAPTSAGVTCANDNDFGGAVTVWRDSVVFPDGHYDIPLNTVPRPLDC